VAVTLALELISSCNLRCKMCPSWKDMSGAKLDRGKVSEIFLDVKKLNNCNPRFVEEIRFDGNTETFVYKELFREMVQNKKLVVWGAGKEFGYAIGTYFFKKEVAYIVDSNPKLWDTVVHGLKIKPPDVLKEEKSEDIVVLITTMHFFSIESQLVAFGIKNYFTSILFLDRVIDNPYSGVVAISLK